MLMQRLAFLEEETHISSQDLSSDQSSLTVCVCEGRCLDTLFWGTGRNIEHTSCCLISNMPVLCPQESITLEDADNVLGQVC